MGHVQKNEVLAKFMENGEWDFHHVEAFPHSPEVEQHPSNSSAQGKAKIIKQRRSLCTVVTRDRHLAGFSGFLLGFSAQTQNPWGWVLSRKFQTLGFGLGSGLYLGFWNATKPRTFLRDNKYLLYFGFELGFGSRSQNGLDFGFIFLKCLGFGCDILGLVLVENLWVGRASPMPNPGFTSLEHATVQWEHFFAPKNVKNRAKRVHAKKRA